MLTVDVSIVIGADEQHILGCLESLHASAPQCEVRVHVVDNGASPETVARLRERFPAAEVIRNAEPRGFAANHNQVMARTRGDYVLLLNDDTVLQGPVLDTLAEFLAQHPEAGAAGCRLVNADGSLQPSTYGEPSLLKAVLQLTGARHLVPDSAPARRWAGRWLRGAFPRQLATYWDHDRVCEVEAVKGACFMVKRSVVEQVGGMDEVTVAYTEEIEWQMRMRRAGWTIYFVPGAVVTHYGGKRRLPFWPDGLAVEQVKGMLNIFRKHRSPAQLLLLRALIASVYGVRTGMCQVGRAFSPTFRARCEAGKAIVRLSLGVPP